jgi:phosphoribosyl-ATP pyrophosphohydrolase
MGKDVKKKPATAAAAKTKAKAKAAPAKAKVKAKMSKTAQLPLPAGLATALPAGAKPRKATLKAEARHLTPLSVPAPGDIAVLQRLWDTVESRRLGGDEGISHSARLLSRGTAKVAQKLGEEAVECVIEAVQGNRPATILESADLLYHLIVVWVDAGIRPEEVWGELVRREGISGIAEKAARPKGILRAAETTKLP